MLFLFDSHFREFLFKLNICAIDIVQSKLQVAKSVAILHVLILKTSTSHLQPSLKDELIYALNIAVSQLTEDRSSTI